LVKSNAGQAVFIAASTNNRRVPGRAAHLNAIEPAVMALALKRLEIPGAGSFQAGRIQPDRPSDDEAVALVGDAIKDCTRRHASYSTFSGSGTTLLAAERVGRHARALEIDPHYVDVAVRRWQAFTGRDAMHSETGRTFEEMTDSRRELCPPRPRRRRA
jgi:hypothetical protein